MIFTPHYNCWRYCNPAAYKTANLLGVIHFAFRLYFERIGEKGVYVLISLRDDFYQVECGILWLQVECFVYAWSLFD